MRTRGTAASTSFLVGLVVIVFALQASLRQQGGGVSTAFATAQSSGTSGTSQTETTARQGPAASQAQGPFVQTGAAAPAGTAAKIWITPRDATITAGDTLTLIIEVQDSIGGPATLTEDRVFSLSSGATAEAADMTLAPEERSWQFFDPDDRYTPIDTLVLTLGTSIDSVYYRNTDTNEGSPHQVLIRTIDGLSPGLIDAVNVTVTTAIDTFVFDVGEPVWTAGDSVSVTGQGFDRFGNPADDDTTVVEFSGTSASVRFYPASDTLRDGRFSVTARDTIAGTIELTVTSKSDPTVTGVSGLVEITPSHASGGIVAEAVRSTITGNGTSSTVVQTKEAVRDSFGNIVTPGTLIDVSATSGSIFPDADLGREDVQRPTDSSGHFTFTVRSAVVGGGPETALVSMTAVPPGTAAGTLEIVFAPEPAIVSTAPVTPRVVMPGEPVEFRVEVQNNSPTSVTLLPTTKFEFDDGSEFFDATLAESTIVSGTGVDTLVFSEGNIIDLRAAVQVIPTLRVRGTNEFGDSCWDDFDVAAIYVAPIKVVDITPDGPVASQGQTRSITVSVHNDGPVEADIDSVVLAFSAGNEYFAYDSLLTPVVSIPVGETDSMSIQVAVAEDAPVGLTTIDAQVSGTIEGENVWDTGIAPMGSRATWYIAKRATIVYEPRSLMPLVVSAGHVDSFSVVLENGGDTVVDLDTATTTLSFTDGTHTYSAKLKQNEALGRGESQRVEFLAAQVPDSMQPDVPHDVRLDLQGEENGGGFTQELFTGDDGDSVTVQTPAIVDYVGGLWPLTVAQGARPAFHIDVSNTGSASVDLDPDSTWISFGGAERDTARLDASLTTRIASGTTTLSFEFETIDADLGTYTPEVQLIGLENRHRFEKPLAITDDVTVVAPAEISITSLTAHPPTFTADQDTSIEIWVEVSNNTDAEVRLDSTNLTLRLPGQGDQTSQFEIIKPTVFENFGDRLPGKQTGTLTFTVGDNGSTDMPTGIYSVEGWVWVTYEDAGQADSAFSDAGWLNVQEPGTLEITRIVPEKETVTQSQDDPWTVTMYVRNDGEAAVNVLDSAALQFSSGTTWSTNLDTPTPVELVAKDSTALVFTILQTGEALGVVTIGGTVAGTELNSGKSKNDTIPASPGADEVRVQTAADLKITSVELSDSAVTENQERDWTIDVTVKNNGEADAKLSIDSTETYVKFPSAVPPAVVPPPPLPVTLGYQDSTMLTFTVAQTPDFDHVFADPHEIDIRVGGTEKNTSSSVADSTTASVQVDLEPDPFYIDGTLTPSSVDQREPVTFELDISDSIGAATVELDTARTLLVFQDNSGHRVRAGLDPEGPTTISPDDTTRLLFEERYVSTDFETGLHDVTLILRGTENGNEFSKYDFPNLEPIDIRPTARVRIDEVYASRTHVSQNQKREWTVTMVVTNLGDGPVEVYQSTRLVLRLGGLDVTDDYDIDYGDYIFVGSGTHELAAGPDSQDELVFTIRETGPQAGDLVIHGVFEGQDTGQMMDVSDNTFDGGWGTIRVDRAGQLRILGIATSQDDVTAGQSAEWRAFVSVKNEGEAAVDLIFDPDTLEIRATPDSGFEWVVPDALEEGGTLLAGDSVGTMVFTATETDSTPGDVTLHAAVAGRDTNSTDVTEFDTETAGSGFGEINVESPGQVVLKSTTVRAPRAPFVNIGQTFGVEVQISNEGQADLDSVSFRITSGGGSGPPLGEPDTLFADFLAGYGGSVVDTFVVQADDVLGSETLMVEILTGVDANSGEKGLLTIGPHDDDQAEIQKQNPATLMVDSVATSQDIVTQRQSADWTIDVAITNEGTNSPPIDLEPPRRSDITFLLDQVALEDYVVFAPDTFLSGASNLRLDPGESDILRYTVGSTGADLGNVTIQAVIGWRDANDPVLQTSQESDTIIVRSPSGLYIDTTWVDPTTAPNNNPGLGLAIVNSGMSFDVKVTVHNFGDVEDLDDVQVELTSNHPTDPVDLLSNYVAILSDEQHTFTFPVDPAPLDAGQEFRQEKLTARIVHAVSHSSGELVQATQARDDEEDIVVQQPAALAVLASVADTTLSANQVFSMEVVVLNDGVAAVDDQGGMVRVTVPQGFEVAGGTSEERAFVAGTPEDFLVRTPTQYALAGTLFAEITTPPIDLNSGDAAVVSQPRDSVIVHIAEAAKLTDAQITVDSPPGAMDNIVSTRQPFVIGVSVLAAEATMGVNATLDTSGTVFNIPAGLVKTPSEGIGGRLSATWMIFSPDTAGVGDFRVRFDGRDENDTTAAVSDTSDVVTIQVVPRAEITLDAYISTNGVAEDHKVSTGTTFDISAEVSVTEGHAGVDPDSPARVEIDFENASLFGLDSGNQLMDFEIGVPVTWTVLAPDSLRSGTITVRIVDRPNDENDGSPAVVQIGSKDIFIETKQDSVTANNLTDDMGLDKKVVPRGAKDVEILAIRLTNGSSLVNRVRIDGFRVSLLDRAGHVVADPSRTIAGLYVGIGEQPEPVLGQVTTDSTMTVDLLDAVRGVELALGESETFVFSIDIARTAELGEMMLSIQHGRDILVTDIVSAPPKTIGVWFEERLRSNPLVILSSNFEDYAHNYPNPFRAGAEVTRIAYIQESETPAPVTVKIFDLAGDLVYEHSYAAGEQGTDRGPQEVTWDGRNMQGEVVRNGLYICQVQVGSRTARIRIAVAK